MTKDKEEQKTETALSQSDFERLVMLIEHIYDYGIGYIAHKHYCKNDGVECDCGLGKLIVEFREVYFDLQAKKLKA